MNLEKLAPWNWFKKEEELSGQIVPVRRERSAMEFPLSLLDLQKEFDRFYDAIRRDFTAGWPSLRPDALLASEWFKPSLDVASSEKEYSVKVELPGIDANDVTIEISANTLKVKGEKKQEKEEKGKNFYRVERSFGSFQRILDLPEDADADKITSSYKDGVLSITIPKKALPKEETKKVEIKVK
jgi:HSP20 family protein